MNTSRKFVLIAHANTVCIALTEKVLPPSVSPAQCSYTHNVHVGHLSGFCLLYKMAATYVARAEVNNTYSDYHTIIVHGHELFVQQSGVPVI